MDATATATATTAGIVDVTATVVVTVIIDDRLNRFLFSTVTITKVLMEMEMLAAER